MFGRNRLKDLIRSNYRSSADSIMRSVIDALEDYRENTKQADDVTLVVIKINGAKGPVRLPSQSAYFMNIFLNSTEFLHRIRLQIRI